MYSGLIGEPLKMRTKSILGLLVITLSSILERGLIGTVAAASPPVVPIGVIYNQHGSEDIRDALRHELTLRSQNRHSYTVQLKDIPLKTDVDDSYSLGTAMCQLMGLGVFSLVGSHSMSTIDTVKSFSATFRMPYVTIGQPFNTTGQGLGFELYIRPMYARAIADLVKKYEWQDLWYIYNSNEGLERLQQFLEALTALSGYQVRTKVYRVTDSEDAYETIRNLDGKVASEKRIILDMNTHQTEEILLRANNDTFGIHHHYIVVDLGISEMSIPAFSRGGMNVTGLAPVDWKNSSTKGYMKLWAINNPNIKRVDTEFVIPFESALTIDAIKMITYALSKMAMQNSGIYKPAPRSSGAGGPDTLNGSELLDCDADIVKPWRHGHEVMKYLRQIELYGLTGPIKFDNFGLRRDFKLDVQESTLSQPLRKTWTWHSEDGFKAEQGITILRPISTIKGETPIANKTRIITSIVTGPYLKMKDQDPGEANLTGNDQYEGYCADLAKLVAAKVGFKYQIVPVKDKAYGAKLDNGSWNGMIGELMRREADLVIAPLTITAAREDVVDFSKPFMSLGISIMVKRMNKEPPSVVSFMKPLSYEIWMCVIFAYIGVSVVLFLVSRFSPFEWHIEDNTDGPTVTNNFTIFNSLWFSLGAFMQQGCDIEPRSLSGRIVGSVWWFFTLIIISSYTANLAAFLTVERMQSPIESADDLAKQTEIKYGSVDSGSTKSFFQYSSIPVYQRMWSFMSSQEPTVFVSSNEEGADRVRKSNGKFAFLAESTTIDYMNQREPCDTMKVGGNLDSKGYGIGTPIGSDLRDRITLAVLELLESGDLTKLETKWWYERGQCGGIQGTVKKEDTTSSLKLSNVAGIFYILIAGLVLALVTAVLEFLYKSKIDAGRRKTSFKNAIRSKARLSVTGKPENQAAGYTYCPAAQLISVDGYTDINSRTNV